MDCLSKIKGIFRKVHEFEKSLNREYKVTLNEAMVICSLSEGSRSSGEISECTEISNTRTSRVLLSLEHKGLIERSLFDKDKRKMMFVLTEKGISKSHDLKSINVEIDFELE